nr:hypothetical protein Iba_chr06aCG5590 [Ipomoea batatas]
MSTIFANFPIWLELSPFLSAAFSFEADVEEPSEEELQVQHALSTEIPNAELSPGYNVNAREVPDGCFRVLYWRGAYVGEILPLYWFKPSTVLLFGALPLGCAYSHVGIPVRLKNFGKRNEMLQMDSETVLLAAF